MSSIFKHTCSNRQTMKILLVFFACFYLSDSSRRNLDVCTCGTFNRARGRIVGGQEAQRNKYPWVVALLEKEPYWSQYCGGSIITRRHVLTAGHCAKGRARRPLAAVVGEHDLREWKEKRKDLMIPILNFTIHEEYNDRILENDIALMLTAKAIDFSPAVSPVCLPKTKLELNDQIVKVLGWGLTETKGDPSNVLREVDLEVIPLEKCVKAWEKKVVIHPNQLCTYREGKDSCNQDSGGPLVWMNPETHLYTQVGLVSYGDTKCGGAKPAVSTDVSAFLDWILEHVEASAVNVRTCTGGYLVDYV